MKRKLFWFVFAMIFGLQTSAQVNHNQGSFTHTIPIHQYADNKGLQLNTQVSYFSGSGFRPNEPSGSMGKNWMLSCGGFIQRIQMGEPDDQYSTDLFPGTEFSNSNCYYSQVADFIYNRTNSDDNTRNYLCNYYPNGYMFSEFLFDNAPRRRPQPFEKIFSPRFTNDVNRFTRFKLSRRALADYSQDKFQFNFNGKVGTFVIGRYTDGIKRIYFESQHNLKVDFTIDNNLALEGIRTKLGSFIITDDDGIKYTFSE